MKDTNIYLFAAKYDALVSEQDFGRLLDLLPTEKVTARKIGDYNHLDYIWADDVNLHVNDIVNQYLKSINY